MSYTCYICIKHNLPFTSFSSKRHNMTCKRDNYLGELLNIHWTMIEKCFLLFSLTFMQRCSLKREFSTKELCGTQKKALWTATQTYIWRCSTIPFHADGKLIIVILINKYICINIFMYTHYICIHFALCVSYI